MRNNTCTTKEWLWYHIGSGMKDDLDREAQQLINSSFKTLSKQRTELYETLKEVDELMSLDLLLHVNIDGQEKIEKKVKAALKKIEEFKDE